MPQDLPTPQTPPVADTSGSRPGLSSIPFVLPDLEDIEPYADLHPQKQWAILQIRHQVLDRVYEREIAGAMSERHDAEADGCIAKLATHTMQEGLLTALEDPEPPPWHREVYWWLRPLRRPMGPPKRERIRGQLLLPHQIRELQGRISECRSRAALARGKIPVYEMEIMSLCASLLREIPIAAEDE